MHFEQNYTWKIYISNDREPFDQFQTQHNMGLSHYKIETPHKRKFPGIIKRAMEYVRDEAIIGGYAPNVTYRIESGARDIYNKKYSYYVIGEINWDLTCCEYVVKKIRYKTEQEIIFYKGTVEFPCLSPPTKRKNTPEFISVDKMYIGQILTIQVSRYGNYRASKRCVVTGFRIYRASKRCVVTGFRIKDNVKKAVVCLYQGKEFYPVVYIIAGKTCPTARSEKLLSTSETLKNIHKENNYKKGFLNSEAIIHYNYVSYEEGYTIGHISEYHYVLNWKGDIKSFDITVDYTTQRGKEDNQIVSFKMDDLNKELKSLLDISIDSLLLI